MPRIRTIKPDFWTDALMVQLPHLVRLFYIALWNAADDFGYIKDEPSRLAMELMPRESELDVDGALQLLVACGRLEWYESEGFTYYRIAKWEDHQRVDKPTKSKIVRENYRKLAIPLESRRKLAEKYGCQPGTQCDAECYYCGAPGRIWWPTLWSGRPSSWVTFPGLEIDHLDPQADGGSNSHENLVLACRSCNRRKHTKDLFSFLAPRGFEEAREHSRKASSPLDGRERKGREVEGEWEANPPIQGRESGLTGSGFDD